MAHVVDVGSEHQKSVVGILEDRASPFQNWVSDPVPSLFDGRLKDVGDQQEEVGGQGVTLPQSSLALNPWSGAAIHQYCRPGGLQ